MLKTDFDCSFLAQVSRSILAPHKKSTKCYFLRYWELGERALYTSIYLIVLHSIKTPAAVFIHLGSYGDAVEIDLAAFLVRRCGIAGSCQRHPAAGRAL